MGKRKPYEKLAFCDDFMFCKVLEDDPGLCKALLEVILGHEINGHVLPVYKRRGKRRAGGTDEPVQVHGEADGK